MRPFMHEPQGDTIRLFPSDARARKPLYRLCLPFAYNERKIHETEISTRIGEFDAERLEDALDAERLEDALAEWSGIFGRRLRISEFKPVGIIAMPPSPSSIAIRAAEDRDLPAIMDIYNHEIRNTTSTFDTEPVTLENRRAWLAAHQSPRHPALVAAFAPDGSRQKDEIVLAGFGTLSAWSERCAYARAAEVSVYVHRDARRRGVGRAILDGLIARARDAGLGVLLARICAEGEGSIALHRSLGFEPIGIMRRVGEKFGRILDIELFDLQLD